MRVSRVRWSIARMEASGSDIAQALRVLARMEEMLAAMYADLRVAQIRAATTRGEITQKVEKF